MVWQHLIYRIKYKLTMEFKVLRKSSPNTTMALLVTILCLGFKTVSLFPLSDTFSAHPTLTCAVSFPRISPHLFLLASVTNTLNVLPPTVNSRTMAKAYALKAWLCFKKLYYSQIFQNIHCKNLRGQRQKICISLKIVLFRSCLVL